MKPEHMKPDHFVAGIPIGGFINGSSIRLILGKTCGHRHQTMESAELCLSKKSWKRGKAVAVDRYGIGAVDLRKLPGWKSKPPIERRVVTKKVKPQGAKPQAVKRRSAK